MLDPIREVLAGIRDPARVFDPDFAQVRATLTASDADYASFAVAFRQLILAGGLHATEVGAAPQPDHTCTMVFVDDNRCIFVRLVTDLTTLDERIGTFRDVRWLQIHLNEPDKSRFAVVANVPIKQLSQATIEGARRQGVTLVVQDHLAKLGAMQPLDPDAVWNACSPGLMQGL